LGFAEPRGQQALNPRDPMRAAFPYFGTGTVALKAFFRDLGAEVVLPPPPTRRTLEIGVRYSPEQICLPFKITLGNLIESLELGADTLFMAAGTRKCRFGYYHLVQERVLRELGKGCKLHGLSQYSAFETVTRRLPEIFGTSSARAGWALYRLLARSSLIHDLDNMVRRLRPDDLARAEGLQRTGLQMVDGTRNLRDVRRVRQELRQMMPATVRPPKATIGIVGEVYLMLEPFANAEIEKELGRLGAHVVSERSLYRHLRHVLLNSDLNYFQTARFARRYIGESPGGEVTKTVGETIRFARQGIDGVLHIFPFTCMPENMALEVVRKISEDYQIPTMSLSFDEHTSKTGLITRLEAFVDMVARRRAVRQPQTVRTADGGMRTADCGQ
jgi:predicted nucleotide-binding protein (sugar kinase/HSP70/actin superfamily)